MRNVRFFIEAAKSLNEVGTVTFSSKFVVDKMLGPINYKATKYLVELGTGNGCVTEGLLAQMAPDAKLLSFEVNEQFCKMVGEMYPDERLTLINDSAEKLEEYLTQNNMPHAEHIISAVPLVVLPDEVGDRILAVSKKCLKKGGYFMQLSYSPTLGKNLLEKHFEVVERKFIFLNLPPAYVFWCQSPIL